MSEECVISLVLSHHNKNMKWWTSITTLGQASVPALKQTVSQLSDGPVLQLRVTAQFYLENKGNYILKVCGHVNPKDVKRGPFDSSLYVFSPPPGPVACKLG